jgi:double-stranded uracil-DNA glycosylase
VTVSGDGRPSSGPPPVRPSKTDLEAARRLTVPDVIAPNLRVLFCGINPGLYTAAVGHHFARPGNRFWPVLHLAGFTERLFAPWEERELLSLGYGITNLVTRTTANAAELSAEELRQGRVLLEDKVRRFAPRMVAIVGVGAYRTAFQRPRASMGQQAERSAGVGLWVLPNTSGLNAHYRLEQMAQLFAELRRAVED